jgi:hypothetical protein
MKWESKNSPRLKKTWMSKSKIKTTFICFFDIWGIIHFEHVPERITVSQTFYVEVFKTRQEAQARRAAERSLIDSSSRQRTGTFFGCSSFLQEKVPLPWIIHNTLLNWFQLTSGCFKNSRVCWKERVSQTLGTLNHLWKNSDIPVQRFKNCFEQWLKNWKHYKELEGDYFEKF